MPWSLAVGADARFRGPGTNFDPPQSASMLKGYMSLLALTARHDAAVFAKWGSVFHMVKPPTALFEPDMLLKAGWCGVKKALGMLGSDSPSAAAAAGAAPGGK